MICVSAEVSDCLLNLTRVDSIYTVLSLSMHVEFLDHPVDMTML